MVTVMEGGKRLQAVWKSQGRSRESMYHSVWLRRNCHCVQCLSLYNQNVVRSHEMDPQVAIIEAKVTGITILATYIIVSSKMHYNYYTGVIVTLEPHVSGHHWDNHASLVMLNTGGSLV